MTAKTSLDSLRTPAGPVHAAERAQARATRVLRVLIVKRDKLGDLLLTTPVLARLAGDVPNADIHVLANDYNAWVVHGHRALAHIWTYARAREAGRLRLRAALSQLPLFWQLRGQRFDYAIVMGGDESHRGIRRAIASGATRVVAYARDPRRYGRRLTDPLPLPSGGHEVDRMLALLAPLGVRVPGSALAAPTFALPPDARAFADEFLRTRGLARRSFVVIGVGARRRKKQPTAEQVLRWSTRLHARHALQTVFMWTPGAANDPRYPGDDALAREVVERGLAHVHPFRGPIRDALGLIFAARTSIIPDSGLMHFAAASEGGVLGLFADPADSAPAARWAPLGPRARHLEATRCVAELDDEDVFAALAPLLDATSDDNANPAASDKGRD